jgi:hypothetical protein
MAHHQIIKVVGDHLVLDGRYYLRLPQEYRRDATMRRELEQHLRDKEQAKTDIYLAPDDDHDRSDA